MPTPGFVPIIGKDFSDVAGQQQFWAGFSQRQDEDNLRRAQQAEEARNGWLLNLRKLQSEDQSRQDQFDIRRQELALGQTSAAQKSAEEARRFGVDVELRKQKLDDDRASWKFTHGQKDAEEQKLLDQTTNYASAKFNTVNAAGQKYDESLAALNDVQQASDLKRAQLQSELPQAVTWDPKLREFRSLNTQDADLVKKASDANVALAQSKADLDHAINLYQIHKSELADLHNEARQYGLSIDKQGDRYVLQSFHPKLNRTWGAPTEPDETDSEEPPDNSPRQIPSWAAPASASNPNQPWSGFTAGTGTNPPGQDLTVAGAGVAQAAPVTDASGRPIVNSQADFDRLPSGTKYINGRTNRLGLKP